MSLAVQVRPDGLDGGCSPAFRTAESLHKEAFEEAQRYKWIESERSCFDRGVDALREWYDRHWAGWLRQRRIEHLEGDRRFVEFSEESFPRLSSLIASRDLLLDRILDRSAAKQENLHVLLWAAEWNLDLDRVRDILELIDINDARIDPEPFEVC